MSTQPYLNPSSLEPLYAPWEEPSAHRVRAERAGDAARVVKGRRRSVKPGGGPNEIVNNLRDGVRDWREAFYAGASDTTRHLLTHWFHRSHRKTAGGDETEFRYYFCQREAIETLIFLYEVRRVQCLSQLVAEFGGADAEIAALGIAEEEDAWTRYAFKLATGSGKTKVMSLAIVWSYFHALRESDSDLARHFVVIAPNLTVYERLKEDFGDGQVFRDDPLIPVEWTGDWNLSVVLQDEASGAVTGGTLYLTNIHRLYDLSKRRAKKDEETYAWMGPPVSKATALDTGAALRDRITGHRRVMVLNDEAHHLWDPGSAWNEAIQYLHETMLSRTGGGLVAQLDFSATPKDNKSQLFKHVVCDAPLGEAVDAGIVKIPILGQTSAKLEEQPDDNAAYKYERHLRLGYERWKASRDEWAKSGKKPLLFVMCEDTKAADEIAQRFNTDPSFEDLNGKTFNLHTNLKGTVKKVGKGASATIVFKEDEKAISDEDLKALRKLSRELDHDTSPYHCIVSVLMLREGWDVRNVTTIVPLRPYSSKANILPEQTLGRGLRRMTPPGQANELVTVVDHPAFASLYQQELAQEGLPIETVDVGQVPATTVSIFPDFARKDVQALDIALPVLSPGFRIVPKLEGLYWDDVEAQARKLRSIPLPLGGKGAQDIEYEGRHLFTGEIVQKLTINLPLLESGVGAVSYFVKQLELICKMRGLHQILGPLIEDFLTKRLFTEKTILTDQRLVSRLGDSDVAEHIRAVFVPLIRVRTTTVEERLPAAAAKPLSAWKAFQVTHSERRPALDAARTLFNLVPCNRELEVAVAKFLDKASDVAAFAKNAGPQSLRIDYLDGAGRLAFYTPDFFVRTKAGDHYLVETKGREDRDVPRKARAAMAWCESASTDALKWHYLFIPQGVFERVTGDTVEGLARTCQPALEQLIHEEEFQDLPLFAAAEEAEEAAPDVSRFIDPKAYEDLPPRYRSAVAQAAALFQFFENKTNMNYAPVFTALLGSLDEAAKGLLVRRLQPLMPATAQEQKVWFAPRLATLEPGAEQHYRQMAQNLRKTLVHNTGISPLGLLRSALDHALNGSARLGGVFDGLRSGLRFEGGRKLLQAVTHINDFRNTYVAHQEKELSDPEVARCALSEWVDTLRGIYGVQE